MQASLVYELIVVSLLAPWLLTAGAWVSWYKTGRKGSFSARDALITWLIGIIGGSLCGAVLFLIIGLVSGDDSLPPDGWSSNYECAAFFGLVGGAFLGAVVAPIAYSYFIRKTGLRKALWPGVVVASLSAIVGGLLSLPLQSITLMFALILLFFFGALAFLG